SLRHAHSCPANRRQSCLSNVALETELLLDCCNRSRRHTRHRCRRSFKRYCNHRAGLLRPTSALNSKRDLVTTSPMSAYTPIRRPQLRHERFARMRTRWRRMSSLGQIATLQRHSAESDFWPMSLHTSSNRLEAAKRPIEPTKSMPL